MFLFSPGMEHALAVGKRKALNQLGKLGAEGG